MLRCSTDLTVVQGNISCPMHKYDEYRSSRTSWGIGVLGSIFVKLTASDGTIGYATGFGGPPACWLIEEHFKRFVIGQDPRDTNKIWDMMWRASMFYGRKGKPRQGHR
jgi:L-rhamnonate dehydratase